MTDKELIKQEIERLDDKYRELRVSGTIQQAKEADLVVHVLLQISNFIDSLPEEPTSDDTCLLGHDYKNRNCENCSFELCKRFSKPVNEDLEEEIQRAYYDKSLYDADNIDRTDFNCIARHFAEWQEKQMMKDAVDAFVNTYENTYDSNYVEFVTEQSPYKFKETEKCKLIIIKEE